MEFSISEQIYLAILLILMGICIGKLISIQDLREQQEQCIFLSQNILNQCKINYQQEYLLKDGIQVPIIEFVDLGASNGS